MSEEGEPTDEALMLAYVAGDASSFERLFQRHRRPLFTYLLHHTGRRAVAEDLFQETFLRLIRGRVRYRPSGRFRTWLFTIAHNLLTDDRRRAGLREDPTGQSLMQDEGEEESATPPWKAGTDHTDHPTDPVATSHAVDLREVIETALLHIPDDQREVFLLRERAGLDYQSIAELTGSGLATAKSRMRYALANLRRRLSDDLTSLAECLHE